jgi:hypothetical protein
MFDFADLNIQCDDEFVNAHEHNCKALREIIMADALYKSWKENPEPYKQWK